MRTVWEAEAETAITGGGLRNGSEVVADDLASGGKAVRVPLQPGVTGYSLVFGAPMMEMKGQVLFTFYLRAENMPPLTDGVKVHLIAHDKQTGQWAFSRETRIYGSNLPPGGYSPLTLALDAPFQPDTYGPEILFSWVPESEGALPVLILDRVEIAVTDYGAPVVTEVWPSKVRYEPGEVVPVRTALVNPTDKAFEGELVGEERRGIDNKREVFRAQVALEPGEEKQVNSEYKLGRRSTGGRSGWRCWMAGRRWRRAQKCSPCPRCRCGSPAETARPLVLCR